MFEEDYSTYCRVKGLCHGSPVQFVFKIFSYYSPLLAMELNVSEEITCK